jgi:uncharacterized membrane protein YsdA (DUF1294 family)
MDLPPFLQSVVMYAGLNLLVFCAFAWDKIGATVRVRRIPEKVLLLAAAFGPFGALIAIAGLRHKTRHLKFLLVPVFAVLHGILIAGFWPGIAG